MSERETPDSGIGPIKIPEARETQRGGALNLTREKLGFRHSSSRAEEPQVRPVPGVTSDVDPLAPGGMYTDPATGKQTPVRKSDF